MQIIRHTSRHLTEEDRQHLHHLERVVDRVIADGKVSKDELDEVKAQMYNHRVTVYELELVSDRILSRIQSGELEWEWD